MLILTDTIMCLTDTDRETKMRDPKIRQPKTPTTDWLSLDDVADELGIPIRSVYAWRMQGKGPRGHRFGKHIRVKRADFEEWQAGHADPAPAA